MADINPNISGSTVDPKWIDGGPENPSPAFDIDHPEFSLPMPVMSGLASGFCERAAVVYGGTVGGQPWDDATSTARANAVSCLAANLALGTVPNASMTNMFVSANTDFMPTKYNTTSNYMKGLDNMLTKLIAAPGGYVRNVTGSTPAAFTFTTLANDARSRSALPSVGSSATSVGSGGAAYTSRFMPALPVVYPIHRKWMMDELKYIPDTVVTDYHTAKYNLTGKIEDLFGTFSVESGTVAEIASSLASAHDPTYDYGYISDYIAPTQADSSIYTHSELTPAINSSNTIFDPILPNDAVVYMRGVGAHVTVGAVSVEDGTVGAEGWQLSDRHTNGEATLGSSIDILRTGSGSALTIPISISFAHGAPRHQYGGGDIKEVKSGQTVSTTSDYGYEIKSGGTCIVPENGGADVCVVSSGGLLDMKNGAFARAVTILSGGTFTGFINAHEFNIDGFYMFGGMGFPGYDYPTISLKYMPSGSSYSVVSTAATPSSDKYYYVRNGGTLTVTTRDAATLVVVEAGGTLSITGSGSVDAVHILPGGSCNVNTNVTSSAILSAVVYPAGKLTTTRTLPAGSDYGNMAVGSMLVIASGASVDLNENSILSLEYGYKTSKCFYYIEQADINNGALPSTLPYITSGGVTAINDTICSSSFVYVFDPMCFCSTGSDSSLISSGWNVFSSASFGANDRTTTVAISSGAYTFAEPPSSGILIGKSGAYVTYRCNIDAIDIPVSGQGGQGGTPISYYSSFRIRQFYEDPGKLY